MRVDGEGATIAVNLLHILGVLLAGWDIHNLLITYWGETLVIGFWAVVTITRWRGWPGISYGAE